MLWGRGVQFLGSRSQVQCHRLGSRSRVSAGAFSGRAVRVAVTQPGAASAPSFQLYLSISSFGSLGGKLPVRHFSNIHGTLLCHDCDFIALNRLCLHSWIWVGCELLSYEYDVGTSARSRKTGLISLKALAPEKPSNQVFSKLRLSSPMDGCVA